MKLDLSGKTAFVSGSSQGIGSASAIELAELGANVIIVGRNEDLLNITFNKLDTSKGQVHKKLQIDYSVRGELSAKIEEFISEGNKVDILINNMGGPKSGAAYKADITEFEEAFYNHIINNQILAQAFIPQMKESGWGRIVNIISTSVKAPLKGLGVSNTIRGAVGNWSKSLANEMGKYNITVNNVLPGSTTTSRHDEIVKQKSEKSGLSMEEVEWNMKELIPMKRFATPEEVASAVVFLASPAASFINGINIPVDGGRTESL
ncbi:MAG: SDR family oxidoreductase [Ichthyobacteriaceae bacterium]|nr:SDR family oxidoreductase [Ichthyobacteriaceae bacterium]